MCSIIFCNVKKIYILLVRQHLYNICTTSAQSLRRWSNSVQMLYKCFVFTRNDIYVYVLFFIKKNHSLARYTLEEFNGASKAGQNLTGATDVMLTWNIPI